LKALVPDDKNDRKISYKYDRRHLRISKTIADGHPFFNTYREEDRQLKSREENTEVTTGTEYDENGLPVIYTDAYGEKSYLIRDAVGNIIWEIGFPVEGVEGVKSIPVKSYLYNAHQQCVGSCIYIMPGQLRFDEDGRIELQGLVAASSLDQKSLTLLCNRGLPLSIFHQSLILMRMVNPE
jgi:hypothetical protein